VPGVDLGGGWNGRGLVTDEYVVLPGRAGRRKLHAISARSRKLPRFKTVALPGFSIGKAPLPGPANVFIQGAYLTLCYEGGIEVYSSAAALSTLAGQDRSRVVRASYLVLAGELEQAIDILLGELQKPALEAKMRRRLAVRILRLVEEVAKLLATNGRRKEALAILDRCEKQLREPRLILRAHLFRLQVYRILGDFAGVEREQEFIESGGVK